MASHNVVIIVYLTLSAGDESSQYRVGPDGQARKNRGPSGIKVSGRSQALPNNARLRVNELAQLNPAEVWLDIIHVSIMSLHKRPFPVIRGGANGGRHCSIWGSGVIDGQIDYTKPDSMENAANRLSVVRELATAM
jgi:hypothetical protein